MVKLLLGAGANPDLQNKVRTVQDPDSLPYCWCPSSPPVLQVLVVHYENIYLYLVLNMAQALTVPLLLSNVLVTPCYVSCKHPVLLCLYDYRYICVYVLNMLMQYLILYLS